MLSNTLITKSSYIGKYSESPTTCLSPVSETEHRGVLGKRTTQTWFTQYQLSELKKEFKSDPYITGVEKKMMAKNLGITQARVANWFCKERKRKAKFSQWSWECNSSICLIKANMYIWVILFLVCNFVYTITYFCVFKGTYYVCICLHIHVYLILISQFNKMTSAYITCVYVTSFHSLPLQSSQWILYLHCIYYVHVSWRMHTCTCVCGYCNLIIL